MRINSTTSRLFIVVASAVLLSACASIDFDYPRTASKAISNTDTADTTLGRSVMPIVASQAAGESGFYPLSDGIDALSMRLLLAARAEQTIDAQYYLIKNDIVGRAFIRALLTAADRGVRVRLLLDDVFTSGYDTGMMALDSHPNFEIRIYNPFNRGAVGRSLGAVTSLSRVNRRMHNKTFTSDNQVTVIGGRNIADEYFGAREDAKFGDLDVVGLGPIVQEVSAMFDTYWNHETAIPVPAFLPPLENPEEALNELRTRLEEDRKVIIESKYAEAVRDRLLEQIESNTGVFSWAPYQLVFDSPDKGIKGEAAEDDLITAPLRESLLGAEEEIFIISPYFVPRKNGIEAFSAVLASGVEVSVITNSLAANNQASVHGGYAPARKPLLKNGIRLFEVRPDIEIAGTEYVDASNARATLHTKAYVVDRHHVFIGSFNFDPRSANLNTELGVIIHDPVMGAYLTDRVEAALPEATWEVFLNADGKLRWKGLEGGEIVILDKEPKTTWGQRFMAGFYRVLPIRSQL
jgi:putative cardiolipin synthase